MLLTYKKAWAIVINSKMLDSSAGEARRGVSARRIDMAQLGISELCIIFAVAVVLFGYKKLPGIGKNLGHGIRNFKRSMSEPDEVDVTPFREKDQNNPRQE